MTASVAKNEDFDFCWTYSLTVRDEEEDEGLVQRLRHVDPETVRLVNCTQSEKRKLLYY